MKRSILIGIFAVGILFLAVTAFAADPEGLVPCSGVDCDACHLIQLGNNILEFFVQIAVFIAVLMFAWGGFNMVMSAGDVGKVRQGTEKMTNAVVGILIVLISWVLVDTVLKMVVDDQVIGVWNDIECALPVEEAASTESPIFAPSYTNNEIRGRIANTEQYKEILCEYASGYQISDQCDMLHAIAAIESNGNSSLRSEDGAVGLMQVTPVAFRDVEPDKAAWSDQQIRGYLSSLDQNVQIATKYYAKLLERYNGDTRKALAAYNGGPSANDASEYCPGLARWECQWDNNTHTDRNEGFKETRDYVANVTRASEMLAQE